MALARTLRTLRTLRKRGCRLVVAVDSLAATAAAAAAAKAKAGHRFEVMIEFNSDVHRAGVPSEPRRIESDFDCAWHKSLVTLAVAPGPA